MSIIINDNTSITCEQSDDNTCVMLKYKNSICRVIFPECSIFDNICVDDTINDDVFDMILKIDSSIKEKEMILICVYLFIQMLFEKNNDEMLYHKKTFRNFVYFYTFDVDDLNEDFRHIRYGFLTLNYNFFDYGRIEKIKSLVDQKMLYLRKFLFSLYPSEKNDIDSFRTTMIRDYLDVMCEKTIPDDIIDSFLYGVLKKSNHETPECFSLIRRSLNTLYNIYLILKTYGESNIFIDVFYKSLLQFYIEYFSLYKSKMKHFIDELYAHNGYNELSSEYANGVLMIIMELYQFSGMIHGDYYRYEDTTEMLCSNGHLMCDFINFFIMRNTHQMKVSLLLKSLSKMPQLNKLMNDMSLQMVSCPEYNSEILLCFSSFCGISEGSCKNELQLLEVFNEEKDFNRFMFLVNIIKTIYIYRMINAFIGCVIFYQSTDKWYKKVFRISHFSDRDYGEVVSQITRECTPEQISDLCNPTKNKNIHFAFENAVFLYCRLGEIVHKYLHYISYHLDTITREISIKTWSEIDTKKMMFYDKIEYLKSKMLLHLQNVSTKKNTQCNFEYMTIRMLEEGDFDNYVFFTKKYNYDLVSQKLNNHKKNKYLRKKIIK